MFPKTEGSMIRWSLAILLAVIAAVGSVTPLQSAEPIQAASRPDQVAWVAEVLTRIQTIKPGMTRSDLLTVFTSEGGISTALHRTFVSRDCPYFKVDVEFEAVGRPNKDREGRVTLVEGNQDRITSISRPYLQFSMKD
jgi:hypothetical protein